MIFTFYSYKGGVGRTMALTNVAELFYIQGSKVLLVDWDLEAPGLERFYPQQADAILSKPGLMEILTDYKQHMSEEKQKEEKDALLPKIEDYLTTIKSKENSSMMLLSAGKRDKNNFSDYAHRVQSFDWQDFYQNWEGEIFFEWLRKEFEQIADIVLIDSRTGVTEIGGVTIYQFADVVVLLCAPNQQNIEGTYEMAKNFIRPEVKEIRQGRPLDLLIVPARVEDRAETRLLNAFKDQFIDKFDDFKPATLIGSLNSFWDLKIPYVPYYSFNEVISILDEGNKPSEDMVRAFSSLGNVMRSFVPISIKPQKDIQNLVHIAMRFPLRVLVVDTDNHTRMDLKVLLENWGYDVQVAEGNGQQLISQSKKIAISYRPHVVIIGLRLIDSYDEADNSGLELTKELKSAHCILYTGYLTHVLAREALNIDNISIVGKEESPERLHVAINNAVKDTAALRDLTIEMPMAWSPDKVIETIFGSTNNIPSDMVGDVISRLFPNSSKIKLELMTDLDNSPLLRKSQSVVLKAWEDDFEPVIIKLAPSQIIEKEIQNYKRYIYRRLTGNYTARLERSVIFWSLGGLTYINIGSDKLLSFSTIYREQEYQEILKPLRFFFTETWGSNYARQTELGESLLTFYNNAFDLQARLSVSPQGQVQKITSPLGNQLPNPIYWVNHHKKESAIKNAKLAITHGNLHSDNILVDKDNVWAIDFEKSGEGPIFRDFVELEIDIITRLLSLHKNNLSDLFEICVLLASPADLGETYKANRLHNVQLNKALAVIQGLRSIAYTVTGISDFREYLWTLLLSAVNLMSTISEDDPRKMRALIYSSVICSRFDHWDEIWPPQDWPKLSIL